MEVIVEVVGVDDVPEERMIEKKDYLKEGPLERVVGR